MAWNLFLAVIPFYTVLIIKCTKSNKLLFIILTIVFVLFFPNAPYLVTDYIHIKNINFFTESHRLNLMAWIRLIHVTLGILLGTLTGMLSLKLFHDIMKEKLNSLYSNILIITICFLSGYGIYIGRFLRFNSWDILSPISLLSGLIKNLNIFTVFYSVLLALYTFAIYMIFSVFINSKKQ